MESNTSNLNRGIGLAGLLMLGGFFLPWFTLDLLWETVSASPLLFVSKGELVGLVPLVGAALVLLAAISPNRRKLLGYLGLSAVPALLVYAAVRGALAVVDSGLGGLVSGDMVAEAGMWLLQRGRIGLWLFLAGQVVGLVAVRRAGAAAADDAWPEDADEPSELLPPLPATSIQ